MFMKHERAKRANVLLILKCRLQNRRYVRPKNQLVSLYVLQIIAIHLLPKRPKFEGSVPNVRGWFRIPIDFEQLCSNFDLLMQ